MVNTSLIGLFWIKMKVGSVGLSKHSFTNGLGLVTNLVWFNGSQLVTKRIKRLPVLVRFVSKLVNDISICVRDNPILITRF